MILFMKIFIGLIVNCINCSYASGLMCEDCVEPCVHAGVCTTQHGKCFVRRDVNNMVYRGCADKVRWNGLDLNADACSLQNYLGWDNVKVLWCFCDTPLCNKNNITSFPGGGPLLNAFLHNNTDIYMRQRHQNNDTQFVYMPLKDVLFQHRSNGDFATEYIQNMNEDEVIAIEQFIEKEGKQSRFHSLFDLLLNRIRDGLDSNFLNSEITNSDVVDSDDMSNEDGHRSVIHHVHNVNPNIPPRKEKSPMFKNFYTYYIRNAGKHNFNRGLYRSGTHISDGKNSINKNIPNPGQIEPGLSLFDDELPPYNNNNLNARDSHLGNTEQRDHEHQHGIAIGPNAANGNLLANQMQPLQAFGDNHFRTQNQIKTRPLGKELPDKTNELLSAKLFSKDQLSYPQGAYAEKDKIRHLENQPFTEKANASMYAKELPEKQSYENALSTSRKIDTKTHKNIPVQNQSNLMEKTQLNNNHSVISSTNETKTNGPTNKNRAAISQSENVLQNATVVNARSVSDANKTSTVLPVIDKNDNNTALETIILTQANAKSILTSRLDSENEIKKVRTYDIPVCGQVHESAKSCPTGFSYIERFKSCYMVSRDIKNFTEATKHCEQLERESSLVTIDNEAELNCLAAWVDSIPMLLEGWQGWWTGASYDENIREFTWTKTSHVISRRDSKWLPSLVVYPYEKTCVWLVPLSKYSLGNYWCEEPSGFICEASKIN